jgi:hypothetical protein
VTRRTATAFVLAAILVLPATAGADGPAATGPRLAPRVLRSDASGTTLEIDVPDVVMRPSALSGYTEVTIPGATGAAKPGRPDLPSFTCFVAVPDVGGVELQVLSSDTELSGYCRVAPVAGPGGPDGREPAPVPEAGTYGQNALYPSSWAEAASPIIMRDLRLLPVRVYPVRWNPVTGEMQVSRRLRLRIANGGGEGENPILHPRPFRSAAFEPLYRDLVANYGELPTAEIRSGSILIITMDSYVSQLSDFVEWKTRCGIETVVVPMSEVGSSPSNQDVKDYIQNAYDTWETPPDYVILVGDTYTSGPAMPCWYVSENRALDATDHPYSLLDGADYFPDVFVGRMSIDTATEAIVASLKAISYERGDAASESWYGRALMCAGNYGPSGSRVTSPRQTTLRVGEMLERRGYAQVDTVFYPPVTLQAPILASINEGVSFVNYRGWGDAEGWHYPKFANDDIYALTNGDMLPVMTSIVCGTGNYDSWAQDPSFCEAWIRAGAPGALKGGPAIVAPSHANTHTKWNNAIDVGIYQGMLFEDLDRFAQAVLRGKIELYRNFPLDTDPGGAVEFYFNVYNILGDPSLRLRTEAPADLVVTHPASLPLGENVLPVTVTDADGNAVPGAEVVVWKEGESYDVRSLEGEKTVAMPLSATTAGDARVTVVGTNMRPYTGTAAVTQQERHVGWYAQSIDDDALGASSGNGDGIVNPGETIELPVTLKNYGTLGATAVSCALAASPPSSPVTVTDGDVTYGDIAAGATATGAEPFVFHVDEGCPDGTELVFALAASQGGTGDEWASEARVVVGAPVLSFVSALVDDGGDGVLDPGESATLTVVLANGGPLDATSVAGTLLGPPSGLTVSDGSGYWGTVAAGGQHSNAGNTFLLSASSGVAPGHVFALALDLTGDDGLSQFVMVPLTVGTPDASDPVGPDGYGYYGYDDTDAGYAETPPYSWIEIDPSYGGSGTDLGLGHEDVLDVSLPFTFRYYGEDFSTMAVCSNGDVGLGGAPSWEQQSRNTTIPCPLGPDAMLAPFWDYLVPAHSDTGAPAGAGKVLEKNLGDGRYVIEWSRVGTGYDAALRQTFELVLFDPASYPTGTGDGEILFQYHTIANADTHNLATVGIENPSQSDGVLYTFYGFYPDAAAPLAAGRAIKFTTDPPDAFPSTDVPASGGAGPKIALDAGPNPFNPFTVLRYSVPSPADIDLSIFDVSGRRVATVVRGPVEGGRHAVAWDGRTDGGERAASGVYFARLSALDETRSIKLVLIK